MKNKGLQHSWSPRLWFYCVFLNKTGDMQRVKIQTVLKKHRRDGGSSGFLAGGLRLGYESLAAEDGRDMCENQLWQVVLTWVKIFLNKLHLEMEDLLLEFTNGVFHFLPSCHHVTEISNLQKHKKQCLV